MAINIRNRPNDADAYKVVDLAIAPAIETNHGVKYDAATNQTTVNVSTADSKHDFIKIGDYLIPQRADCPSLDTPKGQYDIQHPLRNLRVLNVNKGTGTVPTFRSITISGDQRKYFAGAGSPNRSPQGYGLAGINVADIVRGRKYRITKLGTTTWNKFGRLYQSSTDQEAGRSLALVGSTFTAVASGLSNTGETASPPTFAQAVYSGGPGAHASPYIISGLGASGTVSGKSFINGTYYYVTDELYRHGSENLNLQLRGTRKQWTIWNPSTGQIYYEDTNTSSDTTHRFDSPAIGGGFRPSGGNTPSVVWQDRSVSVPTDFHYTNSLSENTGQVVEVIHVSSVFSNSNPLTNREVDQNFIDLESKKLAADGSMAMDGTLSVNGNVNAYNVSVTDKITLGGVTPYSTNTALALGTKDIEVNNIRLAGTITDDALFRKYFITGFPHSFLADYNDEQKRLEPMTILYFANVSEFDVNGSDITGATSSKTSKVRRVNTEHGYIMVKETSSNTAYVVGEKIDGKQLAGPILRVLEPADYLIANQNVKIFGMNQHDTPLQAFFSHSTIAESQRPAQPSAPGFEKRGPKTGTTTYQYKIALLNQDTGKMSALSTEVAGISSAPDCIEFDKANYIRLSGINRTHSTNALVVYRKKTSGAYKLIDIVGNAELGNSTSGLTYNDYGGFDKTDWGLNNSPADYEISRKHELIYVPVTDTDAALANGETATSKNVLPFVGNNEKYKLGWLETRITTDGVIKTTNVNSAASPAYFRITEMREKATGDYSPNIAGDRAQDAIKAQSSGIIYNSPNDGTGAAGFTNQAPYGKANELEFFIDNSRIVNSPSGEIIGGIQKLILDASASGRRTVSLPGGIYYTKLLTLPSNFKLTGQARTNTILKSLPWLGNKTNTKTVYGGNVGPGNNYAALNEAISASPKAQIDFFGETVTGELRNAASGSIERFVNVSTKADAEIGTTNGIPDGTAGIFSGLLVGHISYSRALLDFDGKTGVTIANLTADGNFANNIVRAVDVSGKSNFIATGQRSKNCFLQDVSLENTTGSGIFLETSTDFSMEGSIIKNGGSKIQQTAFATGIYAPASTKIRMGNNLIENFSESNDLTSNLNVVLSGNMFRNTGSGVLAYATSNLVKESNLILGPADEFIPMVDTLNSEYDQINIDLQQDATDYISDTIEFLRDDSPIDLRKPNSSTGFSGVSLHSDIRTLVQRGTSQYLLPNTVEGQNFRFSFASPSVGTYAITTPTDQDDDGTNASLQKGNFSIKIAAQKIGGLVGSASQATLQTKYDALTGRPAGESLVGLIFQLKAQEYLNLDPADTAINWTGWKVDTTNQEITLRISDNYSNLFAIGDRVVFQVGVTSDSLGGLATASFLVRSDGNGDTNRNPVRVSFPVKSKSVQTGYADLILGIGDNDGISASERSGLSSTGAAILSTSTLGASAAQLANNKIGLQNNFVLAKGRIIV
jgi:hypothetical protein